MIQPKAYKLTCPKCGYSKVVKPKSDVLNPMDTISTCPKCGYEMQRKELSAVDELFSIFSK